MKNAGVMFILMATLAQPSWAQETAKNAVATTAKPIAALGWLVGGVWTAKDIKNAPGLQRIETRYQWSDNDAYLRFTTHFVTDKGTLKNYDGQFFYDPEKASLAMWYTDAQGAITHGPVQVEGDVMSMTFRATDFEGKLADLRVKVTRLTNDHYNWLLEEKQDAGWKQLFALEYFRE